ANFNENVREVVRFEMAQLHAPPKRFREQLNPFTRTRLQIPVWNHKWKSLITRPRWRHVNSAALSANGRFLAVNDAAGDYHIADLKTKKLIASYPPEGRTHRHKVASHIAFDPEAKWVVRLAGGRLFARPLAEGKAWETKPAIGKVTDFAFHPGGIVICAVLE